jgi:hypothetical protein
MELLTFLQKSKTNYNISKAIGHPGKNSNHPTPSKSGKLFCGDIVNELPLSQPTVSQHLKN